MLTSSGVSLLQTYTRGRFLRKQPLFNNFRSDKMPLRTANLRSQVLVLVERDTVHWKHPTFGTFTWESFPRMRVNPLVVDKYYLSEKMLRILSR